MGIVLCLKRIRDEAGLSQQAFATACNLSVRAIAKYEAGAEPNILALLKLRRFAEQHANRSDHAFLSRAVEDKLGFRP